MKIYMDVDGVVADFLAGVRHFVPTAPKNPTKWDGFLEGTGCRVDEFFSAYYDTLSFYSFVPLLPRAQELGALADYFVTSCQGLPMAAASKLLWLSRHFPGVPVVIVENKQMLDYTNAVLVDDKPDACSRQILFPTPWNNSTDSVESVLQKIRQLKQL